MWPKDKSLYNKDDRNLPLLAIGLHLFLRLGLDAECTIFQHEFQPVAHQILPYNMRNASPENSRLGFSS